MKKIAISMTTIPRRSDFLVNKCYPSIAASVIDANIILTRYFDSCITDFVLTIDDNLDEAERNAYRAWARTVSLPAMNITIQEGKSQYRCINKEIGGWNFCKKRENEFSAFITVDDDQIYNDPMKFVDLVKFHSSFLNDVVCVETNPVIVNQNGVQVLCTLPPKIAALRSYSKILSNFCLFPTHCFDGTRISDDEYIAEHEWYRHDELFAWAELTAKGIKSIVLPNTYSLAWDNFNTDFTGDEKGLRDYNSVHWNDWNGKITQLYPQFKQLLNNEEWEYLVQDENAFAVAMLRNNGILNGIAANFGKILTFNTKMIRSDSYRKFLYQ